MGGKKEGEKRKKKKAILIADQSELEVTVIFCPACIGPIAQERFSSTAFKEV